MTAVLAIPGYYYYCYVNPHGLLSEELMCPQLLIFCQFPIDFACEKAEEEIANCNHMTVGHCVGQKSGLVAKHPFALCVSQTSEDQS